MYLQPFFDRWTAICANGRILASLRHGSREPAGVKVKDGAWHGAIVCHFRSSYVFLIHRFAVPQGATALRRVAQRYSLSASDICRKRKVMRLRRDVSPDGEVKREKTFWKGGKPMF